MKFKPKIRFSEPTITRIFTDISGALLLDAYRALIPYLTECRSVLLQSDPRDINQLRIIDTVLLKTYLNSSPSMISSLLRLKDNYCIQSECERILRDANRPNELVLLLKRAKKHIEALHLLYESKQDDAIRQKFSNSYRRTYNSIFYEES